MTPGDRPADGDHGSTLEATLPHPRSIGSLTATALAMGGSNQSLFLLGAILATQGSAAVPLLIVGLLLSWAAAPGWLELVLMWPNRVGGIAATCAEAFRPYSALLANLTGVCYWWGWVPTCGLTALLSGSALHQWYLPGIPTPAIAVVIVILFTALNLSGLRNVSRLVVPLAAASASLAFLSALVPIVSGTVDWQRAGSFHLDTPFAGTFGAITSAMAGLYLIGFAAPAFEAVTCHVGEMRDPNRSLPRAMLASAGMASVYFILLPVVWLGIFGPQTLQNDLAATLGPTFAPLLGGLGRSAAIWFMVTNMFHGTLQPLAGASRTLSQLSEDGLLPRMLARRSRTDCPWVATLLTAALSVVFLLAGDPIWMLAAANLTYLIGIGLPSVAVWLLRRHAPEMARPFRAPRGTITLGLLAAGAWGVSTILGFQQFGMPTVLFGVSLAYSGSLFYMWRRWSDRRRAGIPHGWRSLHTKLTGAMLGVLVLDGTGYLIAVSSLNRAGREGVVTLCEDLFVAVALLTISVGLVLPGMIGHATMQVAAAADRLARGTLEGLTRAMEAVGRGDLTGTPISVDVEPVVVNTRDELHSMAESFNAMQSGVTRAAHALELTRKQLTVQREELDREAAARREVEQVLRESEARMRTIIDAALTAVVTASADGVVTGWNARAEQTFGWTAAEIVGQRVATTLIPEHRRDAHIREFATFLATGQWSLVGAFVDTTLLRRDGSEFPVELSLSQAGHTGGDLTLIAFIRDTTERQHARAVRAMSFAVTRSLSDSATVKEAAPRILEAIGTADLNVRAGAIWTVAAGSEVLVKQYSWHAPGADTVPFEDASKRARARRGTGLPGRVWASGESLVIADLAADRDFPLVTAAQHAGLISGAGFPIVADDAVIGVMELFAPSPRVFTDELVGVLTALGRQIGQFMERRRAEGALRQHATRLAAIASTDALTGLKNRREFDLMLPKSGRAQFAIILVDVDNLKAVNDEHGHEGGDVVLQAVALTLASLFRGWDLVARIGGDEFAAILTDVTAEEAASAAERLRLAIHSITVPFGPARVSIGWAAAPAGADPTAVRNAADEALYKAKRGGRDRVEGGDVEAARITGSSRQREATLVSRILLDHAVGVAYQPIVELDGRAVVGFEALARPAGYGATASVEALFAAARSLGRIRDLDWLCRRVAVEAASCLPAGAALFLNVSSASLLDPIHGVDQLLLLLERAGRSPTDIVLEITEQEVVRDLGRLRLVVAAYREHGIRFALDDVGEGHSTLGLLAAANAEFIKIGRSLVVTADGSGPHSAIQAAIAFARSDGGLVIAEGIEDEATAQRMADFGIALGQGYWLGKPAPALHAAAVPTPELPGVPATGGPWS